MAMTSSMLQLLLLLVATGIATSLKLTEIHIEKYALAGGRTVLLCDFNLEGETLYSVKWYKDGDEFYRYLPSYNPKIQTFSIRGTNVKIDESNQTHVVLDPVELSTNGKFTCEVSGEAPSFQTDLDYGYIYTIQSPAEGPRIDGGRPRYQVGDLVKVNCTSGPSKPAANLTWYINGIQAEDSFLLGPRIQSVGPYLEESALGLEFQVKRQHFKQGDLKLKCLAHIDSFYWKSNEESAQGERPQKPPVLEVRDNQEHSFRNDLMQMSSGLRHGSSFILYIILIVLIFFR